MSTTDPGSMEWDLWIDYHRQDEDGLTHASVLDVSPGAARLPRAGLTADGAQALT